MEEIKNSKAKKELSEQNLNEVSGGARGHNPNIRACPNCHMNTFNLCTLRCNFCGYTGKPKTT